MKKSEFLEKVKSKNCYQYDYSLIPEEWTNSAKTKITVICPIHGMWETTVHQFISSKIGCPKCAKCGKLTTSDFIAQATKIHGNRYDYSKVEYKSTDTKVCIICPDHGEFWQTPHSHIGIQHTGCPECSINMRIKKKSSHHTITEKPDDIQDIVDNPIITSRKMVIGTIYCFVNKQNNKKYIGKTVRSNYTLRWNEHKSKSISNCVYFYRALDKYGWNGFDKYVLFQTDVYENNKENKEKIDKILLNKERECIALYKTNNSHLGYNLTHGGDGICGYQFSEELKRKQSEMLIGNKHWNYGKKNSAGKKVKQFNLNGTFIKEYPSIQEAVRENNKLQACNISQCCNNKVDSAGGYIWVYSKDYYDGYLEKYKSRAKCKSNDKTVLQYSLSGDFINEYISVAEASRTIFNDIKCKSNIRLAASNKTTSAFGYIFIYKDMFSEELLNNKINSAKNIKFRKPYKQKKI